MTRETLPKNVEDIEKVLRDIEKKMDKNTDEASSGGLLGGLFGSILGKMKGHFDPKASPAETRAAQGEVSKAEAGVGESALALQEARKQMQMAFDQLQQAQKEGKGVPQAQVAMHKATSELEQAKSEYHTAPSRVRDAEDAARRLREGPTTVESMGKAKQLLKSAGMDKSADRMADVLDTVQLTGRAAAGDPTAIAGLVGKGMKKAQEMGAHAQAGFGEFGKSILGDVGSANFGREGAGQQMGHVFGAGEEFGGFVGGPVGDAITSMSKFARGLVESLDNLRKWDRQLLDASFRFAEFSGGMATARGEQEMRDVLMNIQRGEGRGESTQNLAEAMSDLEQLMLPLENQLANVKNDLFAGATKLTTVIAGPLVMTLETLIVPVTFLAKYFGQREDKDEIGQGLRHEFLDPEDHWAKKHGKPARFPRD